MTNFHISRSWPDAGTPLEDECPCPQEPCGHIAQSRIDRECPQHGTGMKTLRSTHAPEECPAYTQERMTADELAQVQDNLEVLAKAAFAAAPTAQSDDERYRICVGCTGIDCDRCEGTGYAGGRAA